MKDLIRLFIFAFWVTLCIWAYVNHKHNESITIHVPEIVVTPDKENNE
jgi:hypothetical protein